MAACRPKQLQARRLQLNSFFRMGGVHIRPAGVSIRHRDRKHQHCRVSHSNRDRPLQSRVKSLLRLMVVLTFTFRFGEASHPGPKSPGFVLGLLNPTGLQNKTDLINQLPQGAQGTTWLVSETHLTLQGSVQFKKALKLSHSPFKLIHGDFVPPKSHLQSSMASRGKERGVGFLTSVPGRELMTSWTPDIRQHQRCHAAGFQYGRQWLQGGVFYGNAFQSGGLATRELNNFLLSQVFERVGTGARGPRFIGGDFNHFIEDLPVVQTMLQQGWQEVQHLAACRFGQAVQPTIQQKHAKDLLFLSPELTPFVKQVCVEPDWVANHSLVYVVLDIGVASHRVPIWKQPRRVDWNFTHNNTDLEESSFVDRSPGHHTAEERYRAVWHSFENQKISEAKNLGLNIHDSQVGRGATTERTWITENFVPLRPSRPGGFTPEFHGQSMLHTRWIKQLRRLQALAQMHHPGHNPTPHWLERKLGQWHSIVHAPGFKPSFPQWWASKAKHVVGLPPILPDKAPDVDLAHNLALDFQKDVQALERMLQTSRLDNAKQSRLDNPARIFTDLQAPRPEPVQMLLAHHVSTVESIDHEECAVELASANAFEPAEPIEYNGVPLSVIHQDTDKLWLEVMPPIQIGDTLTQTKPITDLEEIYQEFQAEWMKRWDRHARTPDTEWAPIVDFVQAAIPEPLKMDYAPISYHTWQTAVSHKKVRAAVGPDGVSRSDLVALPRSHVEPILTLLSDIEQGRSLWPKQVVTGHVHALEKTPSAWRASQYRPLTVFSIVYRTWSSIRAKQTLAFLSQYVSAQVTGNIPGRSCTDLWLNIQLHLEECMTDQVPAAGVVADLVKAYNLLPRLPLLAIGLHLGIAKPIIHAWANALHQMERAFSVRGTIGPPLTTTTGFAEGCGLSCAAMLLCNIALSRWLHIRFPSIRLWSYVDNLELTGKTISEVHQGLRLMTQFCNLLDLQLDEAKTYYWANDAAERQVARQSHLQLQASARDLGAHMEYGRRKTNHVLQTRVNAMPSLWNALARSPAPYRQKVDALRTKGWPQALSAVSSASLGDTHVRTLRTGACRGLRVHAPGISPIAHLSLVEHPTSDPACAMLLDTVFTLRRRACPDRVSDIVDRLTEARWDTPPRPGPCHVLLERLHSIGWS